MELFENQNCPGYTNYQRLLNIRPPFIIYTNWGSPLPIPITYSASEKLL